MAFFGNDPSASQGGQFGDLQYASVSPFMDPNFGDLYGTARGSVPTSMNSLEQLIQGGVNSPLLQAILGPALTRLMGTEQASRNKVTDAFRSSGGLRSSQYGRTFAENERNIMGERGNLISDIIAKTLGTLVPGQLQEQRNMFLPAESYNNLLKTIRPDVVSGVQRPVQNSGASGGYDDPFGVLSGQVGLPGASVSAADRNNPYSPWYVPPRTNNEFTNQPAPNNPPAPAPNPWGGYGFDSMYGGNATPYYGGGPEYGPWSATSYDVPQQQTNYFGDFPAPNTYAMTDWEF